LGWARLLCGTRCALSAAVVLAALLSLTAGAFADTQTVPPSAPAPWADPSHQSPLEVLASRIATHIAGKQVAIHCESDSDWSTVVTQAGGDPGGGSGFVATQWNGATGQLLSLSTVADLSSGICGPLQQFASAAVKPTKCTVRHVALLAGIRRRSTAVKRLATAIVPCYLGGGRHAAAMSPAYWSSYSAYSIAILTLAHESIHLGGAVGGTLSNGLPVGDPQAEAKGDCYGMQWMPYVAQQLGDTSDDAQAIARYFWDKVYPLDLPAHPEYWSADCRPGSTLDLHLAGAAVWP
jgi:hypothetical protein